MRYKVLVMAIIIYYSFFSGDIPALSICVIKSLVHRCWELILFETFIVFPFSCFLIILPIVVSLFLPFMQSLFYF